VARLIYLAITSLDGYVADDEGGFEWAVPDEEVHAFVNDLVRPVGTHLYGRRMYETMAGWETMDTGPDQPAPIRDFAELWRAADKIVYSRTLDTVTTARTRLEREFDADAVARLKASASADVSVSGPELAAHAIRAGLVDDWHLILAPILVGGGAPSLPAGVRLRLDLVDERRFDNGFVHLQYRTATR
jgi:dihydrofolate reductase